MGLHAANTHKLTNNQTVCEQDGQSLRDLRGFIRSLVVLRLPGARGFDLIKGFESWEWEQGGRKEGRSEGGRGGKTNGAEERG